MRFDDPQVHKTMLATKYRSEQDFIRSEGIKKCQNLGLCNLAVETNSGLGNLTKLYKAVFNEVLTNDINPKSVAVNNFDSLEFVETILPNLGSKIDLIDFDSYRCPVPEVKMLFEKNIVSKNVPLILSISDGLGLWMKRSSKVEKIIDKYLLEDFVGFDSRHPWRQHLQFWEHLLKKLCAQYGVKVELIASMQTKGQNYVLASYLLIK